MLAPVSAFVALIALGLGVSHRVDATQVMSRPDNYKTKTTSNSPKYSNVSSRAVHERASGKNSVAYFVNWGIYGRNFQPSNIVGSTLTHILYSFADVSQDSGTVVLTDTYADQQKHYPDDSWSETGNNLYGCFKQLYLLKKNQRNLKVILSIGGYTYSQSGHFNFVSNPSSRATFVSSSIQLLEDNGLDGIDIDFEYPTAAQANDFASLLSELRAGLDKHAASKGDTVPYQLSVAVPAGSQNYENLNVPEMDKSLTFWNLMAYDYAGSWSNISDHQANLYRGNTKQGVDTDSTINWYTSHGAQTSKINMGLPLYGRAFESTAGIETPFTGVGSGSWENGVWDVKALPLAGSQVFEDAATGASYSYDSAKKELISYDTPNIIKQKAIYIVDKGLAGSMWWELSSDYVGSGSLVKAANSVLGALDQTQNHLKYPGSQFDNVKNCMGSCLGVTNPPPPPPVSTSTTILSTSTSTSAAATTTSKPVSTTPTTTTTSKTTTTTSTSSGGGSCTGVGAWSSGIAYTGGSLVTYNAQLWKNSWWSQADVPGGAAGVWISQGSC